MAKHNETGAKGELAAVKYLTDNHYHILATNWRYGHKEIDVIASHGNILVVVEIKTRGGLTFGFPEEAVTRAKQHSLQVAAAAWLEAHPEYTEVRFDVISIMMTNGTVTELVHLEDAFY